MKFQEKLLYSHIAFEELFDVNNPIHDKRLEALKIFDRTKTSVKNLWAIVK